MYVVYTESPLTSKSEGNDERHSAWDTVEGAEKQIRALEREGYKGPEKSEDPSCWYEYEEVEDDVTNGYIFKGGKA